LTPAPEWNKNYNPHTSATEGRELDSFPTDFRGRDIVDAMTLTGLLNISWLRRTTIAAVAYALSLSSISATKDLPATSSATAAEPKAVVVSDNSVELIHDITPVATAAAMNSTSVPLPHVRKITMQVTAYCPCKKCCGPKAHGVTASGKDISYNDGRFVAAPRSYEFGTKLIIPGYHSNAVEVIDRGGAIKGDKLDVFFPTHEEALKWGRRTIEVTIVD
jgi:3D (Asp-Asp-Asp) domain-containing protein